MSVLPNLFPSSTPSGPRRVLLIRPSALGDVCRTTPVLVSLRRAYPNAAIDWLVQDSFAPAIAHHPDLAEVVPFPRRAMAKWTSPATWPAVRAFLHTLRERGYDLVVDAQGLARSGLFAAATRAPRRVGLFNAAELGWLGLTEGVNAPRNLHTVDRMMLVARAAGGLDGAAQPDMRLYSSGPDRSFVQRKLGLGSDGRGDYVLLAPTTRWPAKQWPADRFATLARRLLDPTSAGGAGVDRVVFVGASHERTQCEPLAALARMEPRVVDLVGRTEIGQLMATIEPARLVIASDSAALHMAVGFDRPLIGLFGPTHISLVGPYGRTHDVIQHITPTDRLDHKDQATGGRLMERITVDEVLAAARGRLA